MKIKKIQNKPGFTLIEIIAVLFIVSLGLVGVLSLIIQNIQGQNLNKNNIIAYQLAQEGVEFVRKVRDTNWNNNDPVWDNYLAPGSYYMDYLDETPNLLTVDSQGDLYKDIDGFYVHGGGVTQTNFNRIIEITSTSTYSIVIHSRVSWMDHKQNYEYDLAATLFNWK
ncbi:MAG: type II secretion system protein [Patescibacteria group bacterium]